MCSADPESPAMEFFFFVTLRPYMQQVFIIFIE